MKITVIFLFCMAVLMPAGNALQVEKKELLFDPQLVSVTVPSSLPELEKEYMGAYHRLLKAGEDLMSAILRLNPGNHTYSETDMAEFNQKIDAFYTKYPKYRNELYDRKEAKDIAHITGLPVVTLSRYQVAQGTTGLKTLTFSVKGVVHAAWLKIYFRLLNLKQGAEYMADIGLSSTGGELETLFMTYRKAGARFHRLSEALYAALDRAVQAESDPLKKCGLSLRQNAYLYMVNDAGRVDEFGRSTGNFPLTGAVPKYYRHAAWLADELKLPFEELAYMQKMRGTFGLRKMIEKWEWLKNREEIIETIKKL